MSALLASRHTLLLVSVLAAALVQGPACGGGGEGSASGATSGETSTGTSSGGESEGASTTAGGLVGTCDPPIAALAPADARLTVDAEGRLRDAQGRDVIMRGLNTGGRSKWAPFVPFPLAADADLAATAAAADAFFERLRPWGVDVVRMPMSWEALEPSRGTYDEGYLDRYEAMVTSAWSRGLRVIVDFHQDVYASPFCGDGFPIWSIGQADPGAPRHDCPGWGIKYLNDAGVRASFDRFWAGEDDLRVDFVAMWSEVLMRLGDHPGVVGFEVINEPGWGTASDQAAWKDEVLAPFYAEALAELRPLAPGLLFFYDDPGIDAVPLADVHFTEVVGEGLVYAPHLYDPGLLAGQAASGLDPLPKLTGMATNRAAQGHAVLLGEFGLAEASLSQGGAEWLTLVLDQVDAGLGHALGVLAGGGAVERGGPLGVGRGRGGAGAPRRVRAAVAAGGRGDGRELRVGWVGGGGERVVDGRRRGERDRPAGADLRGGAAGGGERRGGLFYVRSGARRGARAGAGRRGGDGDAGALRGRPGLWGRRRRGGRGATRATHGFGGR